ncbi:bacterial type II secretion system protein N [mine drainage metagenome]|uniref:Bacterial type II secretion system protein N n=1 Tax=mine drainage metagenome TaxID=410659 RepID=A0A1J5SN07_9ZZZZ
MRWRLLFVGVAAYALGLLVYAPATLIDAALGRASDGRLRLAEAHGTIWSGAGLIEIRAPGGKTGVAKSIAWRFLPQSLLRGHLDCQLRLDRSDRSFPVALYPTRIELADATIAFPATVLGLAVPKLAALRLTGEILIRVAHFSFGRGGSKGSAVLQWHDAGSALTAVSPLGDYQLNIDGEATIAKVRLSTLKGPLQLDGGGSWPVGGRFAFQASAIVPKPYQDQLEPLLRLIAVERSQGRFALQLN